MRVVTNCNWLRRCAQVDWFGGGNSIKTLVQMLKDPIFSSSGLSIYLVGGRLDQIGL